MFLIYGIRRKELIGEFLPGTCPKCGNEGTMQLLVVQPYVHLFWLPLFPIPKRGQWKCMHCEHIMKQGVMPEHVRGILPLMKEKARTPWWTFTGSIILVVPLYLFMQAMREHGREQDALLAQPQVGDVWTIKLGHKHYTLQRVEGVRDDSVFVRANELEVRDAGIVGLSRFQKEAADRFNAERIGYARDELIELDKKGPLHSVHRPKK